MEIKKLLATTPETLAMRQREALLKEVQSTFSKLVTHLQKGEFDKAQTMLFDSPAGDGHGCANVCVSFDHVFDGDFAFSSADIGDVIARLEALEKVL